MKDKNNKRTALSLYPLGFDEAVADVLKIKPELKRIQPAQSEKHPRAKTARKEK
jgi:hypothetical protein